MFLGKVPLPLHPVGANADGLGPNCLELADQIAEVTALHSAAKAHGRGIEEQHDGTIGEEPGQATRRTGLIGKLEISDDIAQFVGGALISLVLLSGGAIGGALFLLAETFN